MPEASPIVFISYSRTDSVFVDRLEASLKSSGFRTWVDRQEMRVGKDWLNQIQDALDECQIVLVVLSPIAAKSEYVQMEYRYAKDQGKLVIPLEYQPTPRIPIDLHRLHRFIFHSSYEQGLQSLLQELRRFSNLAPPSTSKLTQAEKANKAKDEREEDRDVEDENWEDDHDLFTSQDLLRLRRLERQRQRAQQQVIPPVHPPVDSPPQPIPPQPRAALLSGQALAEAYDAVLRQRITDLATIQRIISQFEAVAADPELSEQVPFDAEAAARNLARYLYELQMHNLSLSTQQPGNNDSFPSSAPASPSGPQKD